MKLYFFEVKPFEATFIAKNFNNLDYVSVETPLDSTQIEKYQDANIISVFVHSTIDRELLDKLPKLKYIAVRSSGFDNIDIQAAKEKNIMVSYVPGYAASTVAEFTFGLLLALSRNIIKAHEATKNLDFSACNLMGFDLKNKILGVIGVGTIGRSVIKLARAFDMQVIAYDIIQDPLLATKLDFTYCTDLNCLLTKADIISLHTPYNEQTFHLINADNIRLIKPGALLINTARGELVETQALIWALNNSITSAAALDVLEHEYTLKTKNSATSQTCDCERLKTALLQMALTQRNNVLITPHIAFNTKEALMRILQTTYNNIHNFIDNKSLEHSL